ncbi:MAG: chromosomal replication initiator protein DnaA [Immundisolibacteraceae bacterium]|nr:chromosomal replication initiator protein DnaA [Immundisolibacteraceae bacterium]
MDSGLWNSCLLKLQQRLGSQEFNTWIRPLQIIEETGENIILLAPNRFVLDWVNEKYVADIQAVLNSITNQQPKLTIKVGSSIQPSKVIKKPELKTARASKPAIAELEGGSSKLDRNLSFDNFIAGKSNQLCRAAALQISESDETVYNPLLIYGGVGLGKTHIMHACGLRIKQRNPDRKVVYLHAERFVADMVSSLQHNRMDRFKNYYRSADVLLIDDIQFFAGKERSQEEFFHIFNGLLDGRNQVILSCDRYPKDIKGLQDRLTSRFGWGLSVVVEPPELETRVAIINSKAQLSGQNLPAEVAFFIAKKIHSNVRELEGALRRVEAFSNFTRADITLDLAKEALKDILAAQSRMVTVDNIQKVVAEYFKIKVSDLHSKSRKRVITRPRQIAMSLSKELTNSSLPQIGSAFGGRDHTTVIHACERIHDLRQSDNSLAEDYQLLVRTLSA